ncbi:MAG: aminotransferase class I/II-fold pyridoxal phosphate-dependent enzyme [Chitinophagia bacterium]|nr:aminotransferase class I/II-fold pyridoxal phosphate-dependent enzyme [Chitinophagia bacterium]
MASTAPTLGFDSLCLHGGGHPDGHRAHITPVYASSTYLFESAEQAAAIFKGEEEGYIYSRWGNPTITEAEERIALLEAFGLTGPDGQPLQLKAILHASGMGAISTAVLGTLVAGQKIITHKSLYGGTHEIFQKILPGLGVETVIADLHDISATEAAITSDSSINMLYIETPANPTLLCYDLEQLCALGKQHGLVVCVDNTFATPYLQQPFKYGADLVLHSTTKFLNGHGTAIGGILLGHDLATMNGKITKAHRLLGGNSNAFDAFLLTNGLRTLSLRMERHCANAQQVAEYLQGHEAVAHVNYLGLPGDAGYTIARKQMKLPGAMLSFELKGGLEAGAAFINRLKMCVHAVSLGTCDTLISHPASTTHMGVPREQRLAGGITDGLIRMSVGIENVEDIISDLAQAMGG